LKSGNAGEKKKQKEKQVRWYLWNALLLQAVVILVFKIKWLNKHPQV
jgi:hypothetical protein